MFRLLMSSDLTVFAAEQTKLTDCVKRLVFASRAAGNHLMWGEPADWPHFVQIIPDQQTIDFSKSVYQLGNRDKSDKEQYIS